MRPGFSTTSLLSKRDRRDRLDGWMMEEKTEVRQCLGAIQTSSQEF
jgi:hypothetical protein